MNAINVTELRQHLPDFIEQARRGKRVRVTVRGKVVAEIGPPPDEHAAARGELARLRRAIKAGEFDLADLLAPIGGKWTADRGHL